MKHRVTIILLILISANTFANKQLELVSILKSNKTIDSCTWIFVDTSNSLSIAQISSAKFKSSWIPLIDFNEEYSSSNSFWLHLSIKNKLGSSLSAGLDISNFNHLVDVYAADNGSFNVQTTGFYRSGSDNHEIIPVTNIIKLPEKEQIDLYICIRNITDEKPVFHLQIVNLKDKIKKDIVEAVFDSFLLGMMWIMILYGLFLFIHNHEKLYLFYSLYIVFLFVWYILCFEFGYTIFSKLPRTIYPYSDIPAFIAMLFYIKFIKSFINIPKALPGWSRILKLIQYAIVIFIICVPIFMIVSNAIHLGYIIFSGFSLIIIAILGVLIIKLFKSKIQFSNVIGIGSSFLLLGVTIGVLLYIINSDYSLLYQKIGTILELIVFTFGISLRFKVIEDEKREFQAQLIGQLEENTRIQEKANKELENKVKERTAEIAEKNHQLLERNEEIAAQRDLVTEQHQSITESIQYAKKIQTALLPPEAYVNELIKENFILFKPRDIVSGDFYWIRQVKDYIFVVAADCTGHGVPGALMSMLGISFLNEIVLKNEVEQTNEVLNELRRKVKYSLRQTGKDGEAKDGMDLALAAINIRTNILHFSGAYNPIYIARNKEIIQIKADKMPIGIHPNERPTFTNHEFELQPNDNLYLFSDGFSDQLGHRTGKKFMSKNFRELLQTICQGSMHQQKETLDDTIEDWKGDVEQTDDILVIGIRV